MPISFSSEPLPDGSALAIVRLSGSVSPADLRAFNRELRLPHLLVFGARNLHTWTGWTGIDPEANYGLTQSEAQNEFQTTGAPTYFTLRLNLKY